MRFPLDPPDPAPVPRVADVRLRGPEGRVRGRVHWPVAGDAVPALVVLCTGPGPGGATLLLAGDAVAARLDAVVLAVAPATAAEASVAVTWAADHAAELGADATRLALVGAAGGTGLVLRVVAQARRDGWPPVAGVALLPGTVGPDAALEHLAAALSRPLGTRPRPPASPSPTEDLR
jgi:acetyl esterase